MRNKTENDVNKNVSNCDDEEIDYRKNGRRSRLENKWRDKQKGRDKKNRKYKDWEDD